MKKKTLFILLSVLLIAIALTAVASAGPADRDSTGVFWWWQNPQTDDPVGTAKIVRTDSGISGNVQTSFANDVADYKGVAVTVWLVVFNEPGECTDSCDGPDLGDPDVKSDVLSGAGHFIGDSEMGNFGFHLNEGDNSGSIADIELALPRDENGESYGLIDARTAEIHYVFRSHGEKVPVNSSDMIHTLLGGCVGDDAVRPTGFDDLTTEQGACQDIQFAINIATP